MNRNDIEPRIRESFDRQRLLQTLGARLGRVADGEVEILLAASPQISQQHGFVHAGALAAIADSACGYACLTRMPEDSGVLSVEFKINMLAPALGREFIAKARVIRAGRTISVATADVHAIDDAGASKCVALMQATMMRVEDSPTIRA
ncbi:MAG: PaaI family thioesterase [Phycisphaerae bacterium]|nr:PaaI family thioesterase [Phycisphaerae bacterium]